MLICLFRSRSKDFCLKWRYFEDPIEIKGAKGLSNQCKGNSIENNNDKIDSIDNFVKANADTTKEDATDETVTNKEVNEKPSLLNLVLANWWKKLLNFKNS